jgi:hypothetical protein
VYAFLRAKDVPNVDKLVHMSGKIFCSVLLNPRNPRKNFLSVIICVLQAFEILPKDPPLFHGDIRWPSIVKSLPDSKVHIDGQDTSECTMQ